MCHVCQRFRCYKHRQHPSQVHRADIRRWFAVRGCLRYIYSLAICGYLEISIDRYLLFCAIGIDQRSIST